MVSRFFACSAPPRFIRSIGLNSISRRNCISSILPYVSPTIVGLSKFNDIMKNWSNDKDVKPVIVKSLSNPTSIFNKLHERKELLSSRQCDADDLNGFIYDTALRGDFSVFVTGPNGIGKSELVKNVIYNMNKHQGALSAIYVRCHPNQGIFLDNFGLSLGIRPENDLSFGNIMTLAKDGARSAISEHNKEILIVIDDVSNKIDYLHDLEAETRILSEIKGVSC
eukprot:UN03490